MDSSDQPSQILLPVVTLLPASIDLAFEISMDNEMSEIELGDLDLLGLEDAFTKKYFSSIPSI